MNKIIDKIKKLEGGYQDLIVRAYEADFINDERRSKLAPTGNPHVDSLVEALIESIKEIERLTDKVTTLEELLESHTEEPHFGVREFIIDPIEE